MRAVWFQKGKINLLDKPLPGLDKEEALIKTEVAGICNTDLELLKGLQDFEGIPGHEFVGIVQKDPEQELTGKRVVADINCGCGYCRRCRQNDSRHCPERGVVGIRSRDGAFADYISLPRENLYPVPENLGKRKAVFAEPLAAALEIAQQLHILSQTRIAVLGDGKLGLLIAQALSLYSQDVHLWGHHQEKLRIAENQGLRTVSSRNFASNSENLQTQSQYEVVVEATGSPQGLQEALSLVEPEGTVVLKTTSADPCSLNTAYIATQELKILGSRCGNIGWALYNLQKGRIDVESLIEAIYPFSQFEKAMQHAASKGAKKVLIDFQDSQC